MPETWLSSCCEAPLSVSTDITRHWVCKQCEQPCNARVYEDGLD